MLLNNTDRNCRSTTTVILALVVTNLLGQKDETNRQEATKGYSNGEKYSVKVFRQDVKSKTPKKVILMIADEMGLALVCAGLIARKAAKNYGSIFSPTVTGMNSRKYGKHRDSEESNYAACVLIIARVSNCIGR